MTKNSENSLESMSHDDLHSLLLKVVHECTTLLKRRSPHDYVYTQLVVIYTLCELGHENTKLPESFHATFNALKRDIANEFIGILNAGEIPANAEDLKRLLLTMADIEFVKA